MFSHSLNHAWVAYCYRCLSRFQFKVIPALLLQGRIVDLIRGRGGPDRDRPKTAILGPQFCRILVLGPHFWWSGGGARAPGPPPGSAPASYTEIGTRSHHAC